MQDDSSDSMIPDFTDVKLGFEPGSLQLKYNDITTVMNELALNQVNKHAFLSNVRAKITKWEDGKFLKIVEANRFDNTKAVINLTIFINIGKSILEYRGCFVTYLRIRKYDNKRYLKITERNTYTVKEDITEGKMKRDDAYNNIHDNDYYDVVRICFIDVKSFNSQTKCPNCKHEFVSYVEAALCSIYEIIDCCFPISIKFTGEIARRKVVFVTKEEITIKCFAIPTTKKLVLAKCTLHSKVDILSNSLDESVVINIS